MEFFIIDYNIVKGKDLKYNIITKLKVSFFKKAKVLYSYFFKVLRYKPRKEKEDIKIN